MPPPLQVVTKDSPPSRPASQVLAVDVYGVTVVVRAADAGGLAAVRRLLPLVAQDADPAGAVAELTLGPGPDAVGALDAQLRRAIATHAPEHVFVHAGVVAAGGRALVLPGATHSGKSELVAALVARGATYCSDEYAVLDADGAVHPYARPLSLRARPDRAAREIPAAELAPATAPVPVALIAATQYAAGAAWAPAERTAADGALLLLAHAGQAREHPERVLAVLERAARDARVLEGPRGEAGPAAAALLAELKRSTGGSSSRP